MLKLHFLRRKVKKSQFPKSNIIYRNGMFYLYLPAVIRLRQSPHSTKT